MKKVVLADHKTGKVAKADSITAFHDFTVRGVTGGA